MSRLRFLLFLLALGVKLRAVDPEVHTFSIVAFDPATGDLGVAVESKYFGVGSVVPWARAGVGAVATQAQVKVKFGPEGLRLMEAGKSAHEALEAMLATDPSREFRQVGIVDAQGRPAAHTGTECVAWAGHQMGPHFTVQGNMLAGDKVAPAMAEAYENAQKVEGSELADWLLAALQAAQAEGGDRRGQQSAAILVVRANGGPGGDNDRYIDLRVEDHPTPIVELARLLDLHKTFYARGHRLKPGR